MTGAEKVVNLPARLAWHLGAWALGMVVTPVVEAQEGAGVAVVTADEAVQASDAGAPAQPETSDADAPVEIPEIIVTATKRSENIRDVPASIAQVSGSELEQRGAQGAEDIVKLVPGVNLTSTGDTPQRVTIRGISSDIGTGSTTGILFGNVSFADAYVPFVALDPNPFDIGSVEVLKGPQGTLYGASALNGALRYVPNPPKFGEWEAKYFAQYTSVSKGDAAPTYGAAVNLPIWDDALALRVVGFDRTGPGWVDNQRTGTDDANRIDQHGVRAILGWRPGDAWDVAFTYARQESLLRDVPISDNLEGELHNDNRPRPSPNHTTYDLADVTASYAFDWAQLVSDTSYVRKDGHNFFDASSRITPAGALPIDAQVYDAHSKTYGQEIRLVSTDDRQARWKWTAGLFAWQQDIVQSLEVPLAVDSVPLDQLVAILDGIAPTLGDLFVSSGQAKVLASKPDVRIREKALFADVTRRLGDDWELSLGGRYYRTTSGGTNTQSGLFVLSQRGTSRYVLEGGVKEDGFNPKASIAWHATDDLLLYAAASRGFRVGGIQVGITTPLSQHQAPDTFKSDTLWNYEAGFRTQWFDNRLRFDATGYREDWKNPQSVQADASGLAVFLDNVGGVKSTGADLSLQLVLPVDGLMLTTSASYANTVTSKPFTASDGTVVPTGTRWALAPHWQTATTLSYLAAAGSWTLGGFATWSSLGPSTNDLVTRRPVYGFEQLDLQFSVAKPSIAWLPEVAVIVNNVLDERGITNQFSSGVPTAGTAAVDVYYLQPRSVTVRLMGRFGG